MSVITPIDIPTRLQVGDIGGYLAVADSFKDNLYRGSNLGNSKLYLLIFMVTEIIEWQYELDPDDPTLIDTTNYLMWLVGKWKGAALAIIGDGGGTTLVTGGGSPGGLVPFRFTTFVNSADFPSGDTSYTIPFRCFGATNSDITIVLQNQTVNPLIPETAGDFAYAIQYNLTNAVISFQMNGTPMAPNDDQVMIISGTKIL